MIKILPKKVIAFLIIILGYIKVAKSRINATGYIFILCIILSGLLFFTTYQMFYYKNSANIYKIKLQNSEEYSRQLEYDVQTLREAQKLPEGFVLDNNKEEIQRRLSSVPLPTTEQRKKYYVPQQEIKHNYEFPEKKQKNFLPPAEHYANNEDDEVHFIMPMGKNTFIRDDGQVNILLRNRY